MEREEQPDLADSDLGGDPACWLSQLCPECGAVLESRTEPCWKCGLRPGEVRD